MILKNSLNKSFAELNFLQKTQWSHISIFIGSGAMELKRFAIFKILYSTAMGQYVH